MQLRNMLQDAWLQRRRDYALGQLPMPEGAWDDSGGGQARPPPARPAAAAGDWAAAAHLLDASASMRLHDLLSAWLGD